MTTKLSAITKNNGAEAYIIEHGAPAPLGSYSHAVQAGPFVFISGQGARDPLTGQEAGLTFDNAGNIVAYDIEVQTEAVLKNLITVLSTLNLDLDSLVDVSVFLADMNDFAKFNKVYAKYFNFAGAPARTTIQAAKLPGKNFIEIKATAYSP